MEAFDSELQAVKGALQGVGMYVEEHQKIESLKLIGWWITE